MQWARSTGSAKANQVSIPYLDSSVQHVGISRLRALNVTQLRELDKTLVIQDNDKPLAVLLKYEHFLAMQEKILKSSMKAIGPVNLIRCRRS
jgi:translation initiation factor IF-3